jgi:hypothetical protein
MKFNLGFGGTCPISSRKSFCLLYAGSLVIFIYTVQMETTCLFETGIPSNGLHEVISQMVQLYSNRWFLLSTLTMKRTAKPFPSVFIQIHPSELSSSDRLPKQWKHSSLVFVRYMSWAH